MAFSLNVLCLHSAFLLLLFAPVVLSASFTLTNNCGYTVWPGVLSGAGTSPLSTTGFSLSHGESKTLTTPSNWSGRMWGRTLCTTNSNTGTFTCGTGDCGSGKVECLGGGAAPPATLAEFTLDGSGGMDFYDVSLVDGYNVPMLVVPQSGTSGNCTATGCLVDLNSACPSDLKVMLQAEGGGSENVACKSACEAFGSAQYCCSGEYGNPNTCKPSGYSQFFKNACPRAYSYAYDDATSTFTCAAANYIITFCPTTTTTTSQKAGENPKAASLPLTTNDKNAGMVYFGGDQVNSISPKSVPKFLSMFLLSLLLFTLSYF